MSIRNISRREFLKYLGIGAFGLIVKPKFSLAQEKNGFRASDVVQCFDENATSGSIINESVVQIMTDESIKTLTGIDDVGEAWKSIFPGIIENSIISIKVNCINSSVPTHPEFVNCIVDGLSQMNFGGGYYKKNNVIIWDRTDGELTSSGYTIYDENDPDTVRCFATNHSGVGYDYTCPLDVPGGPTYPSRILNILSDYLLSVAVLKNHTGAQVTLSMKNNYGSVNPVPSHNYPFIPGVPALNQQIRDVITPNNIQRIFIIDALWGSLVSGPGGSPSWNPKKLIMSFDTVACDYQGWNLINEERAASGYGPISWPIYHIETAAQPPYNLGTTDINLIEINNPSYIEESKTIISAHGVLKISPNPFRRQTSITFTLTHRSSVHLDLVNVTGRIVANIYSGELTKGSHRINYNVNKNLAAGTYFLRFHGMGDTMIKKVAILN